jgi:hypothetical protein
MGDQSANWLRCLVIALDLPGVWAQAVLSGSTVPVVTHVCVDSPVPVLAGVLRKLNAVATVRVVEIVANRDSLVERRRSGGGWAANVATTSTAAPPPADGLRRAASPSPPPAASLLGRRCAGDSRCSPAAAGESGQMREIALHRADPFAAHLRHIMILIRHCMSNFGSCYCVSLLKYIFQSRLHIA